MDPVDLLTRWGPGLVFGSVLLEHGGLPVPAAPVLLAAGALAEDGQMRAELVLLAAFLACMLADHAWFLLGRRYGRRLLSGVCRLSLSPDTCVRQADNLIARHGAPMLLVAKFIPGVSAVSIPTAGAMGMPYLRFIAFDGLGSLLWSGAYVGIGMIFARELTRALDAMATIGGWSLVVLAIVLALYIGMKAAHRARLRRLFELVRVSPDELARLMADDPELIVVDARSQLARASDPRTLPRSVVYEDGELHDLLPADARGRTIVTFCTCPNEASAALLAERLLRSGFGRVRVLTGGEHAIGVLAQG